MRGSNVTFILAGNVRSVLHKDPPMSTASCPRPRATNRRTRLRSNVDVAPAILREVLVTSLRPRDNLSPAAETAAAEAIAAVEKSAEAGEFRAWDDVSARRMLAETLDRVASWYAAGPDAPAIEDRFWQGLDEAIEKARLEREPVAFEAALRNYEYAAWRLLGRLNRQPAPVESLDDWFETLVDLS